MAKRRQEDDLVQQHRAEVEAEIHALRNQLNELSTGRRPSRATPANSGSQQALEGRLRQLLGEYGQAQEMLESCLRARGGVGAGAGLRAVRWDESDRWAPPQPVAAPEFPEGPPRPPRCWEGVGGAESGLRRAGSAGGWGAPPGRSGGPGGSFGSCGSLCTLINRPTPGEVVK